MPDIGAIPLTSRSSSLLLSHIISECQGQTLIFDLDSTLLNNRPRNAVIMREFGGQRKILPLLKADASHFPNWSASNSMRLLGLLPTEIDALAEPYQEFWLQRFFSSEYCRHDVAVSGAVQFVQNTAAAGAQIRYLTGRHDAMRAGTVDSLYKLGFPVPVNQGESGSVELITKKSFDEPDDDYKQQAIKHLNSSSSVLAAFDNEPNHINSYRTAFPNAISVHLMTDHSMRDTQLLKNIHSIRNFNLIN